MTNDAPIPLKVVKDEKEKSMKIDRGKCIAEDIHAILERVKDGDVKNMMMIATLEDGDIMSYADFENRLECIGALEFLKGRFGPTSMD